MNELNLLLKTLRRQFASLIQEKHQLKDHLSSKITDDEKQIRIDEKEEQQEKEEKIGCYKMKFQL
jgi:hypothetical protein